MKLLLILQRMHIGKKPHESGLQQLTTLFSTKGDNIPSRSNESQLKSATTENKTTVNTGSSANRSSTFTSAVDASLFQNLILEMVRKIVVKLDTFHQSNIKRPSEAINSSHSTLLSSDAKALLMGCRTIEEMIEHFSVLYIDVNNNQIVCRACCPQPPKSASALRCFSCHVENDNALDKKIQIRHLQLI